MQLQKKSEERKKKIKQERDETMRDDQPIWAKREDSRTLRTAARENGHRREKK